MYSAWQHLLNVLFISDFALRMKSSAHTSYGVNSENFQVTLPSQKYCIACSFFESLEMSA